MARFLRQLGHLLTMSHATLTPTPIPAQALHVSSRRRCLLFSPPSPSVPRAEKPGVLPRAATLTPNMKLTRQRRDTVRAFGAAKAAAMALDESSRSEEVPRAPPCVGPSPRCALRTLGILVRPPRDALSEVRSRLFKGASSRRSFSKTLFEEGGEAAAEEAMELLPSTRSLFGSGEHRRRRRRRRRWNRPHTETLHRRREEEEPSPERQLLRRSDADTGEAYGG